MGKKMLAIAILAIMCLTTSALAQQKDFTLTKQGVGAIKFGMRFDQIPAKCEGLYTHFKKEAIEDEMDGNYINYTFYYDNVKVMLISQYSYDTTISFLTSFTPRIKAINGMHVGMPSVELYTRKARVNLEGALLGYYSVDGYCFFTSLSASGEKKANDAYISGKAKPIAPSDFPKGAKITEMSISNY